MSDGIRLNHQSAITHIYVYILPHFPTGCHRCFRRWICRMGSGDILISVLSSIRPGRFVMVAVGQSWMCAYVCVCVCVSLLFSDLFLAE